MEAEHNYLQKLADSVPAGMGIYRVYKDGSIELVYLNEGYYLMLGTTRAARKRYLGFSVFDAVHEEDRSVVIEEVMDCIKENRPVDTELRVRMENGNYKWFSIRANIMEQDKDSTLLYCAYSDIDELKCAKMQLEQERSRRQESDTLLQSILENLPGAVVSFEMNNNRLRMTYISDGCKSITGFTAKETMSRMKQDVMADVHADDRAACHTKAMKAVQTGSSFHDIMRVRTASGGYTWVSLTLTPSVQDSCIRYYGIYLDVSKEQEHQQMLNQLVDYLPGGIAIFKFGKRAEDIKTLYYSEGLQKISKNTPEELAESLTGDILNNCIYEDDLPNVEKLLENALDKGAPFSTTYRLKCADGTLVWTQVYGKKIRDDEDGQVYYTVFTKPTLESYLYQSIVEDSASAVLVVDIEYRKIVFANTAWRSICQIPQNKKVVGEELEAILPKKDIMISKEVMYELPEESYREFHEVNAHGRYLRIFARRLIWNGRQAYICHATDETELQVSKKRLQNLIDMVPGGIAIYDIGPDGISLNYINEAYAKMMGDTGKTRTEFLGDTTILAVHPDDRHIVYEAAQKLRSGEDVVDIQFRVPKTDGQYLWVRMIGAVVKRTENNIQLYASYSDCDEIVKAQQELLSSRVMLDEALKIASVMVWKYDRRQHTITDSGTLGSTFHLPKRIENLPQSLLEAGMIAEDSRAAFMELFDRLDTQLQTETIVRALSADGKEYRMYKLIYTSVLDEQGNYLETIGTSIDVTEQLEREHNYEEQLHLKEIMANTAVAVAHFNLTKNSISAIESKQENIRSLLNSGSADQVFAAMRTMLPLRQRGFFAQIENCEKSIQQYSCGQTHFTVRHQLQNDSSWYESRFDLLENPYTGDIEAILVLNDVTYEVRAEQVVSVLMKIDYESVLTLDAATGAPSPFVHTELAKDMKGVFHEQQATGNPVDGVTRYLQKHCIDEDKDRVIRETSLSYVKEVLAHQPIHTCVYTLKLDKKRIHKRAIYAYLDDSRSTLLCAIQDITDTYRKEELRQQQLTAALQEAQDANQKKTDFFSQMSHDMRTPMNGILGLANLSAGESDPLKLKEDMSKIRESGEYLLSLINDTLDFQRIESGKMTIEPSVVMAQSFLNNIVDMIRPAAEAKHITFRASNHGVNLHQYVRMDPVRVKQIIVNLLSNAIKFTPENGVVSLDFECEGHEKNHSVLLIRVKDSGIGMSQEFLKHRIFQPFSQEHNSLTRQYAGSGLGLSIVHRLVELMGGTISVESEQGLGTTFLIHMDFEMVEKEEAIASAGEDTDVQQTVMNVLKGRRILLVEDHPLNAEIAKRLLEKAGCEVLWAKDGKQGVELFGNSEEHDIDAVLMDIRMPVMNGLEAAKAIRLLERKDAAAVPIIAMTANAYEEDVKQVLEAGMDDHLAKPVEPAKLYQTLEHFLCV